MLKQLRNKKTAKKIWIVLAILILPAFVLWGSGSIIRNKEEAAFSGRLFGRKVSFLEYKDAIDAVKNSAIIRFGDKLPEAQKYLNLESQAWDRLMLLHEAKRRGIKVSDREVVDLIMGYPFFQRKGRFDERIYSETLRYVFRTKERTFEEQTRQNLTLVKLYNKVTANITLSDNETGEEYRKSNEEVSIYYIAALPANFIKEVNPSEQEVKSYFEQNPSAFKQPLSFNLQYAAFDSENKAEGFRSRLNKRGDFIKLAKDFGVEAKETGSFAQTDPIPGIGWEPQIIELVSGLKEGQFLPPIQMDKFYYIIKLKEIREPYIPDFGSIKEKVKEIFIKDRARDIARGKAEESFKNLKSSFKADPKSADFNKIARDYGLKYDSTGLFKYGSYIEGIGASDNLWLIAQDLKEGDFSKIISMPSGFYIIKLKTRTAMDEKQFEKEKAEFQKKILAQKKDEYFVKFLMDLKKRAQ